LNKMSPFGLLSQIYSRLESVVATSTEVTYLLDSSAAERLELIVDLYSSKLHITTRKV